MTILCILLLFVGILMLFVGSEEEGAHGLVEAGGAITIAGVGLLWEGAWAWGLGAASFISLILLAPAEVAADPRVTWLVFSGRYFVFVCTAEVLLLALLLRTYAPTLAAPHSSRRRFLTLSLVVVLVGLALVTTEGTAFRGSSDRSYVYWGIHTAHWFTGPIDSEFTSVAVFDVDKPLADSRICDHYSCQGPLPRKTDRCEFIGTVIIDPEHMPVLLRRPEMRVISRGQWFRSENETGYSTSNFSLNVTGWWRFEPHEERVAIPVDCAVELVAVVFEFEGGGLLDQSVRFSTEADASFFRVRAP